MWLYTPTAWTRLCKRGQMSKFKSCIVSWIHEAEVGFVYLHICTKDQALKNLKLLVGAAGELPGLPTFPQMPLCLSNLKHNLRHMMLFAMWFDGVYCRDPLLFFPSNLARDCLCFLCVVFDKQSVTTSCLLPLRVAKRSLGFLRPRILVFQRRIWSGRLSSADPPGPNACGLRGNGCERCQSNYIEHYSCNLPWQQGVWMNRALPTSLASSLSPPPPQQLMFPPL